MVALGQLDNMQSSLASYRGMSPKLSYLQCIYTGDTLVLYLVLDMNYGYMGRFV